MKFLVDQSGLLGFFQDCQGFPAGDGPGIPLGAGIPRGFAERKAVQLKRIRLARVVFSVRHDSLDDGYGRVGDQKLNQPQPTYDAGRSFELRSSYISI